MANKWFHYMKVSAVYWQSVFKIKNSLVCWQQGIEHIKCEYGHVEFFFFFLCGNQRKQNRRQRWQIPNKYFLITLIFNAIVEWRWLGWGAWRKIESFLWDGDRKIPNDSRWGWGKATAFDRQIWLQQKCQMRR